ncbi:hypothetical protein RFI_12262 [Reticulomyxa filosa]|uniref:Uncharacterized protein n=1 Tax=Reticulomyxa filosa TaxID=46433 RepID=X6NG23_RETFI|nr:hypothetical protein RFI_12262 [Reticulomyxa filosa]|eukprot:ETO24896.1 hypothetical protein RFI_12262 [Reticulomyxa filosa]
MSLFETKTREEKLKENKRTVFSLSECYNKSWISLTNEAQRLNTLICCICNQIVNNAMELNCGEHENEEQVCLVREECLQKYLKQNNGKCPIQQHDHCEFLQGKTMRKLMSELLVICPRQFDLKKRRKYLNKSNSNSKNSCNFKGKILKVKEKLSITDRGSFLNINKKRGPNDGNKNQNQNFSIRDLNKHDIVFYHSNQNRDNVILCIKFISLKKKKLNKEKINDYCGVILYYDLYKGPIRVW